jgi:hypothetical protein
MFYWSYKDIHVVLSDDEEMALVQELGKDPLERVGYHTSRKVRKDIEQRIFRYFEQSLHADPEAFNRKYVFRSCYGKDAQRLFPVLLDAYGRITRRATIGSYGERSQLDELTENVYYATTDKVFQITLFERGRWPWSQLVVSGHITLPVSSIEKIAGTADNFFVATTTVTIKFYRDYVRISILEISNRPNNRMDTVEE